MMLQITEAPIKKIIWKRTQYDFPIGLNSEISPGGSISHKKKKLLLCIDETMTPVCTAV